MSVRYPVPQASRPRAGLPGTWNIPLTTAGAFDSSGTLSADAATVAGSAVHLTLHTSSGALAAAAAVISGVAAHQHAASGALSAQSAEVSGSAERSTGGVFATSGALAAADAVVAGDAVHLTLHATSGGLEAQSAEVAGDSVHLTLHATTGALQASAATISGAGVSSADIILAARRRRAGGVRNYLYKDKLYRNITNEQLVRLIRHDLIDITREDIKVSYKSKKPHKVSQNHWTELQETMKRLNENIPESNDDEDIEEIIALL